MRVLLGIAIILAATAIGAAVPWTYQTWLETSIAKYALCDALASGEALGHLAKPERDILLDAVVAAPEIDPVSRKVVEGAKAGCSPHGG